MMDWMGAHPELVIAVVKVALLLFILMTAIAYVVQSGALKNLSLRWRNATNRSSYARGADENRVMLGYAIKF